MPAIRRHWTAAEVRDLIDASRHWPRYELIDGELLVTPAPAISHQVAVDCILVLLDQYLDREPVGVAFTSPADLELRPDTITQPDVFVVPNGIVTSLEAEPRWADIRSLFLAVEVISPSSFRTDRVDKRDFYMDAGVPLYWIIDLEARAVEQWSPAQQTPRLTRSELVWWPIGAGTPLTIDVEKLFAQIAARMRRIRADG